MRNEHYDQGISLSHASLGSCITSGGRPAAVTAISQTQHHVVRPRSRSSAHLTKRSETWKSDKVPTRHPALEFRLHEFVRIACPNCLLIGISTHTSRLIFLVCNFHSITLIMRQPSCLKAQLTLQLIHNSDVSLLGALRRGTLVKLVLPCIVLRLALQRESRQLVRSRYPFSSGSVPGDQRYLASRLC